MASVKSLGTNNLASQMPTKDVLKNPAGLGQEFQRSLENASAPPAAGLSSGISAGAKSLDSLAPQLKFSTHAVERMRSRGIAFSPDEMKGISEAVGKAAQKGSKDTLVLSGESALIVSVKNNTVVTVMDRDAMKNNVFTNIDSTVVI